MRRPGGIVPPGRIGLLMLAAALVPIVLKEAKPLVRAAGRGLRKLGDAIVRIAETSQIDAAPEEPVVPEPENVEPVAADAKPKRGKKPTKTK